MIISTLYKGKYSSKVFIRIFSKNKRSRERESDDGGGVVGFEFIL
jgi:hypothetical protein